jgi:hypothetical protein
MQETLCLVQHASQHIVDALPQLQPCSSVGNTLYAIVLPPGAQKATLSGPALTMGGVIGWPHVAAVAAQEFFQRKPRRKTGIIVLLIVNVGDEWHCVAMSIPLANQPACDGAVPLACANSVLAD